MVWIRGEAKTVCSVYVAVSAGAADKASVYGCLLLCWCIEYYIPSNDLKQGVTDGNSHKFVLYLKCCARTSTKSMELVLQVQFIQILAL